MIRFWFVIVFSVLLSCKKESFSNFDSLIAEDSISKAEREQGILKIDTLLITAYKSKTLMDFYKSRDYKTVWQSDKNRKIILETIKNCEKEGLNPEDYNVSKLEELEKNFAESDDGELINYDLLLSYNLEKYLKDLHCGKLNPLKLYSDWDLHVKELDVKEVLNNALEKDCLAGEIEKCQPKAQTYGKLIKALEKINEMPEDSTAAIDTLEPIIYKHYNPEVKKMKAKLIYWGDLEPKDSLTAFYDWETLEAVKRFQVRNGLLEDGVIGRGTIKALNFTKEDRKHQIIVNLERWRWYSRPFEPNYVLINIPDYSLNVVENQNVVLTKRIVVGKEKRRTPVLSSVLQTVVFNPTWTVPPTILKEDIVPEMIKDRNYLKRKGIGIYDSDSNEIDPSKWNPKNPRGYRYIQKPGYNNALGVVKINFPNRFSVYLHDTNHRDLFDRNFRSLSSGCVRIEKPLELVELLLNNQKKYSKEKVDSIVDKKKTLFVRLIKRYAIYQWYWTAWSEEGELRFRNDIYNLDADLYAQLRN